MIALVTDSTCDLPKETMEKYNIEVVPLTVHFGDDTYYDKEDLKIEQFFTLMEGSSKLPSTSQPSVGLFMEKYEALAEKYDKIISIHISGALSGTCESARLAAVQAEGVDAEVVDSRSTSTGLGFLVVLAAQMIENGRDVAAIKNKIIEERKNLTIYFTVNELSYLEKGGRIGKAQAFLGSVLNFNPILELSAEKGEITPKEKVRGYTKTNKKLLELTMNTIAETKNFNLGYIYGKDSDNYKQFKEFMEAELSKKSDLNYDILENRIGAVLSSHTGPLVYGIVIYKGELPEA
ncbi:DegV family protein [Halanaerobium sp. Z-7514]|uniref:DegV family protein n=1 Tax=Halanaerobium polyolivorans TaxID=2886943 RepID=A0AAW4WW08_9FIRM|nr:DegV family protein [Halanaerobium polyolivorans]MCC3144785.1 DegV family protein [Halanaerobium polyolivorans]RQD70221.1 MAG: DegV family protein [Halanaerobium sp. MSAO_Bac5]